MVDTKACKSAIVAYVTANPGHISKQFGVSVDETPAKSVKNWKRISKYKDGTEVIRVFDCAPFDDQIRAYVTESNGAITQVTVEGE